MKIYIAGKITGDLCYKLKFEHAALQLENAGHIVLNPATLPSGMKPAEYMRICFAMIDTADAVMFLPDWQDSAGARLERAWCEYTGKTILDPDLEAVTKQGDLHEQ